MRTVTKHDGPYNDLGVVAKLREMADIIEAEGFVTTMEIETTIHLDGDEGHSAKLVMEWHGPFDFIKQVDSSWISCEVEHA